MPFHGKKTIISDPVCGLPTCEVITIGTELLLGQIVDTNTVYLAQELGKEGVMVRFRTSVGDHIKEIVEVLNCAIKRCDMVIVTGGLGPTLDDLTREAVASTAGVKMAFRQDLMDEIELVFRRYGYPMPENNRRQAFVPEGSEVILNPVGTAPGFIKEINGVPVVCLPGVPKELKFLVNKEVIPRLRKRFDLSGHKFTYRVLKTVGAGESKIDQMIGDLIQPGRNPEVGLLASQGEIKIRIAARAGNAREAQALIDSVEREVRSRLGNRVFGKEKDTLEGVVDNLLTEKGLILSVFETFTGGVAAQRLHLVPSWRIVKSIVMPNEKHVIQWLGHKTMAQAEEMAIDIAQRVREKGPKKVGLSLLGFPEKTDEDYRVKLYTAVAGEGIEKIYSWEMGGDLNTLQQRGAIIGLNTLRLSLLSDQRNAGSNDH